MTKDTSADWDQAGFEASDRRRARGADSADGRIGHDLLHLTHEPAGAELVRALVHGHSRRSDAVHTHGETTVVSCAPGDAAGLRTRLDGLFREGDVAVAMQHDTFHAGSDFAQNVAALGARR